MSDLRDHSGCERLRPLIRFALSEGWVVLPIADGGLALIKPGLPPIYVGSIHQAGVKASGGAPR
jgi:hypothetical protein